MITIGLLGCGRIGQMHAQLVLENPRARLAYVADAVPELASRIGDVTGATDLESDAIITREDVDGLIIATPTDTHCALIEKAMTAGKAVLCEKPMDLSSARIRSCLETIGGNSPSLLIGFNRRFDPAFAALEARIRKGEIGAIETLTIISRDPAPPPLAYIKTSGGLFRDMMIHDFDMARFILSEEPVEVYATGSTLIDPAIAAVGDVDTASVIMRTASGRICQITNSRRAAYGYDQRLEVHGENGMLRVGNMHENTLEMASSQGFSRPPVLHFFLERYKPAYARELDHFLDCIAGISTPCPSGHDGLRAQMLAEAADQSCKTGTLVRLEQNAFH